MKSTRNRTVFQTFCAEVINEKRLELLPDALAPNVVHHGAYSLPAPGHEGFRLALTSESQAFPDHRVTIEDLLSIDDKVVARCTISGTHTGAPFLGLEPSGRKFSMEEVMILRFDDGLIAEMWVVVDVMSMMVQLGAVPAPGSFD
jgi:predicted ester cyclase